MRIEVSVIPWMTANPRTGEPCSGIQLECERCGHCQVVAGDSGRSYRRGYRQMQQTCPKRELNYYTCDDEPEDDL